MPDDLVVAPAEPIAPIEPAAPVVPADPDEAQAVEVDGGKMVPLAALKAVREENKTLKSDVDKLNTAWQAAAPTIQFLQQNPQFMQGPKAEPAPVAPAQDPELLDIARSLDFYQSNGQPDLDRAAKHQAIITKQATRIAQQMIAPVANASHQSRAEANWALACQEILPNGQKIDPAILATVWRQMPVDQLSNPQVARVMVDQAGMMQMRGTKLPPAPPSNANPPLHTESAGAGGRPKVALSDLDRAVAASRGIPEDKMQKHMAGYVKGRPTELED